MATTSQSSYQPPIEPALLEKTDFQEDEGPELQLFNHFIPGNPHIASEQQARWWIFKRNENGLVSSGAMIKKGGRWYVNVPRLKAWILAGDEA